MENLTLPQILLTIIISGIMTSIPPIVAAFVTKKSRAKEKAELKGEDASSAQKLADAYDKVVEDLQIRIEKMEGRQKILEEKIEKQNKRIYHLEQGVYRLVAQVRHLGAEPVFTLEEPRKDT